MPEELVLTPGGYRPKSMVHYIEPSHILDHAADGTLRKLDSSGKLLAELAVIKAKPAGVGRSHHKKHPRGGRAPPPEFLGRYRQLEDICLLDQQHRHAYLQFQDDLGGSTGAVHPVAAGNIPVSLHPELYEYEDIRVAAVGRN